MYSSKVQCPLEAGKMQFSRTRVAVVVEFKEAVLAGKWFHV